MKVELVERESFDELAARFRLERGQVGGAQILIGRPIAVRNSVEQPLGEGQEFGRWIGHM